MHPDLGPPEKKRDQVRGSVGESLTYHHHATVHRKRGGGTVSVSSWQEKDHNFRVDLQGDHRPLDPKLFILNFSVSSYKISQPCEGTTADDYGKSYWQPRSSLHIAIPMSNSWGAEHLRKLGP